MAWRGRRRLNRFITEMKSLKRVRPTARQTADRRRCRRRRRGATNCWRSTVGFAARFSRSAIFFISEVALLWKKDYLRKTTCDWLCGYDAAFVKLLWPLVSDITDSACSRGSSATAGLLVISKLRETNLILNAPTIENDNTRGCQIDAVVRKMKKEYSRSYAVKMVTHGRYHREAYSRMHATSDIDLETICEKYT